jgi:hypothetical protein
VAAHKGLASVLGTSDARGLAAGGILAVVAAVVAAGAGVRRPAPAEAEVPRMAVP